MKTRVFLLSCLALFIGLASPLGRTAPSPTAQVQSTIDAVLDILRDARLDRQEKRQRMRQVIASRFDFRSMSRRTLGKNWRQASDAQQQRFEELFQEILANTYLVAIEAYTDEIIEYVAEKRIRDQYAQVDTVILRNEVKTPVNYKLQLKGDEWLAYDVVIEGVSLIRNYRGSYQTLINREGIDGLLRRMEEKVESSARD